MPKVGRNDPCPCGSGKKYKNCCMRQDRISESRELSLDNREAALLNTVGEYAQSSRFLNDTMDAFDFYWGGAYTLEFDAEYQEDLRRTVEWFVHDYHTSTDRRYIIDLFIETQAADYPREAREILQAWSQSVTGLFRLVGLLEESRIDVYDPLQERDLVIFDPLLSQNARKGDILIGRLFELDGVKRLSNMTLILPGEYEEGLASYVSNAHSIYQDEHPDAAWDEFLRENGHIFNAYLLSSRAEGLRSLIGPGTRFHDPVIFRDRLRDVTREREREHQKEVRREQGRSGPEMHRTASGIILPGAEAAETSETEPEEQEDGSRRSRILIPGRDS